MTDNENPSRTPLLHIYRGPELNWIDAVADESRRSLRFADAETEMFWAGRTPALRRSARLAA